MKTLLSLIFSFLTGWIVSQWWHSPSVPEAAKPTSLDKAITFSGDNPNGLEGSTGLPGFPPGSRYSREELLSLLRDANQSRDIFLRQAILREWASKETKEGIEALFESENQTEAWQLLYHWAVEHPLIASGIAFSQPSQRREERVGFDAVMEMSLKRLLFLAPEEAIKLEKRFRPRSGNHSHFATFLDVGKWSLREQKGALEALSHFENSYRRWRLAEPIIQSGNLEPLESIQWIEDNVGIRRRENAFEAVVGPWVEKDPREAARYVASRLDGNAKSRGLLRQFLRKMAAEDQAFLVDWMKEQDPSLLKNAYPMEWVFLSPEDQALLAESLGPEFDWIHKPERQSNRSSSFRSSNAELPDRWPPEDAGEAQAWLARYRDSSPGIGPSHWTIETMNQTLELAAGNIDDVLISTAMNTAKRWAKHDPRTAISWAAQLPDHLMFESAEVAVAEWFQNEPLAALEYVNEMPAGEFRSYALERVARDWLRADPEPAIKWVNQMPRGFDKDLGRQQVVRAFLNKNPKRSFFQANAIDHPAIREQALEESFQSWIGRNPAAVLEFLPEAKLDESIRSTLRNQAKRTLEAKQERAQ